MINSLDGLSGRLETAEKIGKLENWLIELSIWTTEEKNERKISRLRDLWDNIWCTKLHVMKVPGEEREK